MQTAYRPVLARTPAQNLMVAPGHTVVLWSPERLNLSSKKVGIQILEARHFVICVDQTYHARDTSETIFTADANEQRSIVGETKTAMACAVEIMLQHGGRGVQILGSLIDVPEAKVEALENKLVQRGWFEAPQLQQLLAILDEVPPSDDLEATAISDIREGVVTAIEYRSNRLNDQIGEAQRSKDGGMGRSTLTSQDRAYYDEVGIIAPTALTQMEPDKLREETEPTAKPGLSLEDVLALMDRNNQVVVGTLAEAMNNFGQTIINQTQGKDSTNGEETGKNVTAGRKNKEVKEAATA